MSVYHAYLIKATEDMVVARKLSISELERYCNNNRYNTFSFSSQNQPVTGGNSIGYDMSFSKLKTMNAPDMVYLLNDGGYLAFSKIKNVLVNDDNYGSGRALITITDDDGNKYVIYAVKYMK